MLKQSSCLPNRGTSKRDYGARDAKAWRSPLGPLSVVAIGVTMHAAFVGGGELKGVRAKAKVVGNAWDPDMYYDDDLGPVKKPLWKVSKAHAHRSGMSVAKKVEKPKPSKPWIHPRCANESRDIAAQFAKDPSVIRFSKNETSASRSPLWGRSLANLTNDTSQWYGASFIHGVPWEPERNRKHHRGRVCDIHGDITKVGKWECEYPVTTVAPDCE